MWSNYRFINVKCTELLREAVRNMSHSDKLNLQKRNSSQKKLVNIQGHVSVYEVIKNTAN